MPMVLSAATLMTAFAIGEAGLQLRHDQVEPATQNTGQLLLFDDAFGLHEQRMRHTMALDGPELLGTVKPGLMTWVRGLQGERLTVDHSDYFLLCDPYSRSIDRQHGVYYRDPYAWR